MNALARFISVVAVATSLISCQSLHLSVKPKAAPASSFLAHAAEMKPEPKRSPFRLNWTNPSVTARRSFETKKEIHIGEVTLEHLRPMSKGLARAEVNERSWREGAKKMSTYAREEFSKAFRNSKRSRFHVVEKPGRDSLTLDLAIVEMNPNSFSGAFIKTAVNSVAMPGTDLILAGPARSLKGNIAIEGRLRDSRTGESLFEFADNEESKSPAILNVRDFVAFGQARLAIREWAPQLDQLLNAPEGARVKDSSSMTLRMW